MGLSMKNDFLDWYSTCPYIQWENNKDDLKEEEAERLQKGFEFFGKYYRNLQELMELIMKNPLLYDWDSAKTPTKTSTYRFKVRDTSQIDWDKVYQELSYKQPLALVQVGQFIYFVVHDSMRIKADNSGLNFMSFITHKSNNVYVGFQYDIGTVIGHLKVIKEASYLDPDLEHTQEVVVTLPKV